MPETTKNIYDMSQNKKQDTKSELSKKNKKTIHKPRIEIRQHKTRHKIQ